MAVMMKGYEEELGLKRKKDSGNLLSHYQMTKKGRPKMKGMTIPVDKLKGINEEIDEMLIETEVRGEDEYVNEE